jgi:hypothetical protein
MKLLKSLIEENLAAFPELEYYLPIVDKALDYEDSRPDTAIECCNSLLQGFSKTIILNLDKKATREELDAPNEAKSDKLIKRALLCLKINDDVYEDDFARRGASLALSIAQLRNARGDISHGKAVPKTLNSDQSLAAVSNEMTGSLLRYMLSSYIKVMINQKSLIEDELGPDFIDLKYDANPDFNDHLDELNPIAGKLLYSEALFALYLEDYEIQLTAYEDAQKEEKE